MKRRRASFAPRLLRRRIAGDSGEECAGQHFDWQSIRTTRDHQLAELAANGDQASGNMRGLAMFAQQLHTQATVMTYSDLFWLFGVIMFVSIPLVLLLKPLPKAGATVAAA